MTTIRELVEAPVDWFESFPPDKDREFYLFRLPWRVSPTGHQLGDRARAELRAQAELRALDIAISHFADESGRPFPTALEQAQFRQFWEDLFAQGEPSFYDGPPGQGEPERTWRFYALRLHFLNELHDLLCSDEKYSEERKKLLSEYHAGQTAFAAGVATALAPYVGGGAQFLVAAAATSLTIIGQVGLKSWCAVHAEHRRQEEDARRKSEADDEHSAGRRRQSRRRGKQVEAARRKKQERRSKPPSDPAQ